MADIKTKEELLEEELKVDKHSLLGQWRAKAYDEKANKGWLQKFWQSYFLVEKGIYEELLKNLITIIHESCLLRGRDVAVLPKSVI